MVNFGRKYKIYGEKYEMRIQLKFYIRAQVEHVLGKGASF